MTAFNLELDVKPLVERTKAIEMGLDNRSILHERIVIYEQRQIFQRWGKGWPALSALTRMTRSGSSPLSRSGALKQSLTGQNPGTVGTAPHTLNKVQPSVSTIGTNLIYAGPHNRGDLVEAKHGQFITIPMSKEAAADGSFPHHFHTRKKALRMLKLRNRPGYIVVDVPSKAGLKKERKSHTTERTKAHWLLVESVQLPERRFMPTEEELKTDVKKVGIQWLDELYTGKLGKT